MCLHSPCALLYLIHNLARITEWGIKMGKYDNYSFKKGIEKAQRRLNRLLRRKRCDPEKLEKAKKELLQVTFTFSYVREYQIQETEELLQ